MNLLNLFNNLFNLLPSKAFGVFLYPECGDTYYGGGSPALIGVFEDKKEAQEKLAAWNPGIPIFFNVPKKMRKLQEECYVQKAHITLRTVSREEVLKAIFPEGLVS